MQDVEPSLARASNAQGSIEGVTARLREIDCAQHLLDRCHMQASPKLASAPPLPRLCGLRGDPSTAPCCRHRQNRAGFNKLFAKPRPPRSIPSCNGVIVDVLL